jgi:transposase
VVNLDANDLPNDVTALRVLLVEENARLAEARAELTLMRAELAQRKAEVVNHRIEIEHLKAQLAKLRRMQFGTSPEKLDAQIAQLELVLEDLEESGAAAEATAGAATSGSDKTRLSIRIQTRPPFRVQS